MANDKTNEILNYHGLATNIEEAKKWIKTYVAGELSGFTTDLMINVTYSELVALRDTGKLKLGMYYRLTDYETIIPDSLSMDFLSAGHKFDIILKADANNSLNENVRFIEHQGEDYFKGRDGQIAAFILEWTYEGWNYRRVFKRYPEGDSSTEYAWVNVGDQYSEFDGDLSDVVDWNNINITMFAYSPSEELYNGYVFEAFYDDSDATITEYQPFLPQIISSNLSAWEGKYCIDNDTSRFKFADGGYEGFTVLKSSSSEDFENEWMWFVRCPEEDGVSGNYAWNEVKESFCKDITEISDWTNVFPVEEGEIIYTESEIPAIGYSVESNNDFLCGVVLDCIPHYMSKPAKGKGVIYCLKDEFGNEAPYDFKNIQQRDGEYTFGNKEVDYSIGGNIHGVYDNKIKPFVDEDGLLSINQVRFTEENTHSNLVKASCQNSYIESALTETDISMNDDGELVLFKTQGFISGIENKEIPFDWSKEYLTIEATQNNTNLMLKYREGADWDEGYSLMATVEFSFDKTNWETTIFDDNGTFDYDLNSGETIYFRGINFRSFYRTDDAKAYNLFRFNKPCYVYGNPMSLIYGEDFIGKKTFPSIDYIGFGGVFAGMPVLSHPNKKLVLPATTLTDSCYGYMFSNCTNLVNAPELPASELAESCYTNMFEGCTNLTQAPELPATTLAGGCYYFMFYGCTSLTTSPELPATKLADYCYEYMFSNCTNLNYIKCLATNISAPDCTNNWIYGVQTNSGTFIKHPDMQSWTTGNNGMPTNWTVEDAVLE